MIPSVKNVLGIYENAGIETREAGMDWYRSAHEFAKTLDTDIERAAGIIAALSPLSGWENNKNKAAQLYSQNGIVCWDGTKNGLGLSKSVEKAQAIFWGEKPLDILVANKTRSFYLNILDPESKAVTIDRHAFDIAVGKKTDDKTRGILGRKGIYAQFSEVYCEAADIANIRAAQMQAITWVTWREIHGIA